MAVLPFFASTPWTITVLALLLLEICLYPSIRYFAHREKGLPTIAVFSAVYAFQFALPVFTRDALVILSNKREEYLADSDVAVALIMAIVGICALQAGFYWFAHNPFRRLIPVASLDLNKRKALLYCVLAGFLGPYLDALIPAQYQLWLSSITRLVENQVLVVVAVLGWIVYSRKEARIYTIALYSVVLLAVIRGLSRGVLEEALVAIAVAFMVKWRYTNKVSAPAVMATIGLIIFLSPVKAGFRANYSYGDQSTIGKATTWVTDATQYWIDVVEGNDNLVEAAAPANSRADLIHQIAYTYSMTPETVPFQYGATYSYLAISLIPRVLWPDKPEAGEANRFFGVSYGFTTEAGATHVVFGISFLGEAYINFGWPGVVVILFLEGFILGLLQYCFGEDRSGAGANTVFVAFFVFFLNGMGTSAEIVFGNILQNVLSAYVLLLWVRERKITVIPTESGEAFMTARAAMNSTPR